MATTTPSTVIASITSLPMDRIIAGDNDRKTFKEIELRELADSIQEHGLAQPITVRPFGAGYQIVAGERRFRAHEILKATFIPAIVKEMSDREAADIMLIENVQRVDLNPMDEARAYDKRIHQFDSNVTEIAKAAGVSQTRVRNRLRLCLLIDEAQHLVEAGHFGLGFAEALGDLDRNHQLLALRAYNEAPNPSLPWFRTLCHELFEQQAQEAMFDLAAFMQASAIQTGADKSTPTYIPTTDKLPQPQKKAKASVMIEQYIVDLIAAKASEETVGAVGNLYIAIMAAWHMAPANPSPLMELSAVAK